MSILITIEMIIYYLYVKEIKILFGAFIDINYLCIVI